MLTAAGAADLRRLAVARALPGGTGLADAVAAMELVQFDPIRRPAPAQDLILRQRVPDYRRGDLERRYGELGLEEDVVHVYGAVVPGLHRLIHPRDDVPAPSGLAAEVLAVVEAEGPVSPRVVAAHLPGGTTVNAWGGQSAATTRALEELHFQGLIRVAGRTGGAKVYERRRPPGGVDADPDERLRALVELLLRTLAPVSASSLRAAVTQLRRAAGLAGDHDRALRAVLDAAERRRVGGVEYLLPAGEVPTVDPGDPHRVRFLAPFDPLVWDRRRFEHLWGWAYRFEAYTPAARRRFGYYALPVLAGDRMVGWVNVDAGADGSLAVEDGYADRRPAGRPYRRAFDEEVDRLRAFLTA